MGGAIKYKTIAWVRTTCEVNENFGSHMDIAATLISMISEKSYKINSWGKSLLYKPKIKLLTSHYFDCLDNICITNEPSLKKSAYLLQNNEELVLCKEDWCEKKSSNLKNVIDAFSYSGINYIFNYNVN